MEALGVFAALEESNSRIGQLEKVVDDYNRAQEDIAEQKRKAEELEMKLQETATMHEEEKARLVRKKSFIYISPHLFHKSRLD